MLAIHDRGLMMPNNQQTNQPVLKPPRGFALVRKGNACPVRSIFIREVLQRIREREKLVTKSGEEAMNSKCLVCRLSPRAPRSALCTTCLETLADWKRGKILVRENARRLRRQQQLERHRPIWGPMVAGAIQ